MPRRAGGGKGASLSKRGTGGVGAVHQGPFPRNGISYTRNLGAAFSSKPNPALFHSDKWHSQSLQQFSRTREACMRKRPVTGSVRINNNSALPRRLGQVAVRSTAPSDYHHRLAKPVFSRTSTLTEAKTKQAPKVADGQFTKPLIPRRGWGGYAYAGTHTSHISGNWYYTVNPLTSNSLDYHSHPTRNTNTACLTDDSIVRTGYYFNKRTKQRSWQYPKQLIQKLHGGVPQRMRDVDSDSDEERDDPSKRLQPESLVSKVDITVDLGQNSSSYGKTARGILTYKKDPSGTNLRVYLNKKLNPHEYPSERRWKR